MVCQDKNTRQHVNGAKQASQQDGGGVEPALIYVAADRVQLVALLFRLDELREHGHAQGIGQLRDAADDLAAVGAVESAHERAVKLDDVELIFEEDTVDAIADMAIEQNIGARGLRSIIEAAMRDVMFNIPSEKDVKQCIIKKETITERKPPILIYKNGSQEKNISEAASSGKALGVS